MIAIDTNIIIRLLTHDDEAQYQKSFALFDQHSIFISDSVVQETEWVLRYAYKFSTQEICNAFLQLFGLDTVHLARPNLMHQAILWHQQGMDFSDALHLAQSQACKKFYTFDQHFIKKAKALTSCSVVLP